MIDQVTIPGRFNGPPASANGGYACGLVAEAVGSSATVRLAQPPPLDMPLTRRRDETGTVHLLHGRSMLAEGRAARPSDAVPAPPSFAEATRAAHAFPGRRTGRHPFPGCFVCGPLREADGLRVFPGPAGADGLLAAPWTPAEELATDGIVDPVFVWAALDCPSGFACMPPGSQTVLATMTASLEAPVHAGRPYVVTAWRIASEGRKHRAGSAIHDEDGRRVAFAEALWITLKTV
jgi:hypothetical protein